MRKPVLKNRNWLLFAAFGVTLGGTVFFGIRMMDRALHWSDARYHAHPIAGWMTPRYVVHSWHVPPKLVRDAIDIGPDNPPRRMSLSEIADARGVPVQTLIDALETAIAAHEARR